MAICSLWDLPPVGSSDPSKAEGMCHHHTPRCRPPSLSLPSGSHQRLQAQPQPSSSSSSWRPKDLRASPSSWASGLSQGGVPAATLHPKQVRERPNSWQKPRPSRSPVARE